MEHTIVKSLPGPEVDLFGLNSIQEFINHFGYHIDVRGPYLILFHNLVSWSAADYMTEDSLCKDRTAQALVLVGIAQNEILRVTGIRFMDWDK